MQQHSLLRPFNYRSICQRQRVCLVACSQGQSVKCTFRVHKQVAYGLHLAIVGSGPALGNWDSSRGQIMTWGEGHNWSTAEVDLPAGVRVEYKYVTQTKEGKMMEWQPGANISMVPPPEAAACMVNDTWNGKGCSMTITRQRSRSPSPPPQPDAPQQQVPPSAASAWQQQQQQQGSSNNTPLFATQTGVGTSQQQQTQSYQSFPNPTPHQSGQPPAWQPPPAAQQQQAGRQQVQSSAAYSNGHSKPASSSTQQGSGAAARHRSPSPDPANPQQQIFKVPPPPPLYPQQNPDGSPQTVTGRNSITRGYLDRRAVKRDKARKFEAKVDELHEEWAGSESNLEEEPTDPSTPKEPPLTIGGQTYKPPSRVSWKPPTPRQSSGNHKLSDTSPPPAPELVSSVMSIDVPPGDDVDSEEAASPQQAGGGDGGGAAAALAAYAATMRAAGKEPTPGPEPVMPAASRNGNSRNVDMYNAMPPGAGNTFQYGSDGNGIGSPVSQPDQVTVFEGHGAFANARSNGFGHPPKSQLASVSADRPAGAKRQPRVKHVLLNEDGLTRKKGSMGSKTDNELRTELKRRGLPCSGNRQALLQRLVEAGLA